MSTCQYEMRQNANIMANNRIMEELGISVLASTLSSSPKEKKTTSKGGGSGTKGKRSGNNASRGEGLIYHIISLNLRSLMVEMTIQT